MASDPGEADRAETNPTSAETLDPLDPEEADPRFTEHVGNRSPAWEMECALRAGMCSPGRSACRTGFVWGDSRERLGAASAFARVLQLRCFVCRLFCVRFCCCIGYATTGEL